MIRSDTVVGVIGGVAAGYVLWLLAFSIADDNAAVGQSRRQLPNGCQPRAIHPQKSRIHSNMTRLEMNIVKMLTKRRCDV
jgi:hypothetical protein